MNVGRRAGALVKNAALAAGMAVAVLCILLAALGFLVAGLDIWLTHRFDPALAAAITGGVLIVLAILVAVIGAAVLRSMRRKQPTMLAEFGGTVGLAARLISLAIRRDPKKAIILSVIAGALAEYLTAEKK